jgi:hypothetical protein
VVRYQYTNNELFYINANPFANQITLFGVIYSTFGVNSSCFLLIYIGMCVHDDELFYRIGPG